MDKLTADLPVAVRKTEDGKYSLRRTIGATAGFSLWADYQGTGDEFEGTSFLVNDDLPGTAVDDFDTYVDAAKEEMRCLVADARIEFG